MPKPPPPKKSVILVFDAGRQLRGVYTSGVEFKKQLPTLRPLLIEAWARSVPSNEPLGAEHFQFNEEHCKRV
jgi:hypothetical protein